VTLSASVKGVVKAEPLPVSRSVPAPRTVSPLAVVPDERAPEKVVTLSTYSTLSAVPLT
jgi:hypothetical protein